MKTVFCAVTGAVVSAVAQIFGGWSFALTALLILMGIDYITGLIVAGVFHASPKSTSGRIESGAGWKGLLRKCVTALLVAVAALLERLLVFVGLELHFVRDAVAIAFSVNEIISIIENAGLMGVPVPKVMQKALEALQKKSGEGEGGGER